MNEQVLLEARNIIAGFLKNRRIQLGISQQELADKCGMARETISRMEAGKFWLGMKQYLLLCEALNCFPVIAEMEAYLPIAEQLRSNWVSSPSISIEKAEKLLKIIKSKTSSN